jgi:hypothetical protein
MKSGGGKRGPRAPEAAQHEAVPDAEVEDEALRALEDETGERH